jgi:hypothetical protein
VNIGGHCSSDERACSSRLQRLLALWATKTVLAFQMVEHDTTRFADHELYKRLYTQQAPPARTGDAALLSLGGLLSMSRRHQKS